MTQRSRPLEDVPISELVTGTAELWKKSHRQVVAKFDGVSMRPTIEPFETVTVHCGETPGIGDVVLAIRKGLPVVHRVIWMSGHWLLTRGDARTIPDPPLAASEIVGVISGVPGHQPRPAQRVTALVVVGAGIFGRISALAAIRLLQLASVIHARLKWKGPDDGYPK